ncbi:MAG: hypothetical protein RR471_10900 [Bacteroides sp.]
MKTPATVTPDMIKCLAEMQSGDHIQGLIEHLEEFQDTLLSDEDESPENLITRIHLMKTNKYYLNCIKRFLTTKGDNNE